MQHGPSLRGIYSAALAAPKPKNVATVSPVIEDDDDDELETPHKPHDGLDRAPPVQLQTKSSLRPSSSSSTLRFPFTRSSNQDDADVASASAEKYAVVGQKQQWRRDRAQRAKASAAIPATIRHVSEDEVDGNGETREEYGERASSYLPSARSTDRPDVLTLAWPSSGRSQASSYHSSRESARSGSSSGRYSSSIDESGERELFSITRQKKSRFAAKLYMPGQNPLYLGRYRTEEAARAACEEAFASITTPRK